MKLQIFFMNMILNFRYCSFICPLCVWSVRRLGLFIMDSQNCYTSANDKFPFALCFCRFNLLYINIPLRVQISSVSDSLGCFKIIPWCWFLLTIKKTCISRAFITSSQYTGYLETFVLTPILLSRFQANNPARDQRGHG